jgi:GGDEF domain-containing protein
MNLKQMAGWGQGQPPEKKELAVPNSERCLTLLIEGTALNVPEIDREAFQEFRANVGRLSMQIPDRLPDEEKLSLIRTIVHEFEVYRNSGEKELRECKSAWHVLATTMLRELLTSLGMGTGSPAATLIAAKVADLETAEDVRSWREELDTFLHPAGMGEQGERGTSLTAPDRTTANDNAAGLRGGGLAVEHLKRLLASGGNGFIVLFKFSCLDMITQRFGSEAVQDCLMAASAFLTSALHSEDAIYHWSDSTLLAILQGRTQAEMITAELQRIVSQNRETTVKIGQRLIMLRIPITFEVTPIDRLHDADDLYKIT